MSSVENNYSDEAQLLDDWWPISWAVSFEEYAQNPGAFRELKDRYAMKSIASMRFRSVAYLRALAVRLAVRRGRFVRSLSMSLLALSHW